MNKFAIKGAMTFEDGIAYIETRLSLAGLSEGEREVLKEIKRLLKEKVGDND